MSNEKNLRGLSRFLWYRSNVYKRICSYYADMIDLSMRSVIPMVNLLKDIDNDALIKSYYNTLVMLEKWNLPLVFLPAYLICFREDVFYGCAYHDDEGIFILPLDPDYCKITGIYKDGSLAFDMDMSYFTRNQDLLEYYGEPFQSMWNEYRKNTSTNKWQPLPDDRCVCLKYNYEDWTTSLPPFMGLFDSLINLEDLREIMQVYDEQMIYQLLIHKVPLLNNSSEPNDFAIDLDLLIDYFNKYSNVLPDYANSILSLTDIESISFHHDSASDVNKVENATKNVMISSGGSQVLSGGTGSTSINLAMRNDENLALSSLLPQTEAIVNRLISLNVKNAAKVKFLEVTSFTKQEYRDTLIRMATYGVPVKTELAVASGFNELEIISKGYLEKALGIQELYIPLQSSNTMNTGELNNPEGGRPAVPDSEITDDGEASKEKRENRQ